MSAPPPWVISSLSEILGFDEPTVKEAIIPDLEGQKSQVKLKSHLQDFLGPSPAAKAFIDKYIAYRFPGIPTPTAVPSPGPSLKSPVPGNKPPGKSNSSTPNYTTRQTQPIPENLDGAFGPNAKLYQKNKQADQDLFARYSPNASGSSTPQFRHPHPNQPHEAARHGGFLTVHQVPARPSSAEASGKKADKIWDLPKSKEVKRLEEIREKLLQVQEGNGKVEVVKPFPDCFCQARNHPLSSYTPTCQHCGLILCTLHPVYAPCPSCHNTLLSPAQLARVLLKIQQDIDAQLAIEQAERDAVERERQQRLIAESGGGSFPTLSGGPARPTPVPAALPAQERRVLTLGKGKGKGKTTLTTTTIRPVSNPSSRPTTPPPDDIYPRPRSPPFDFVRVAKDLNKVLKWRADEDRPWGNIKEKEKDRLEYQELPISHFIQEHAVGRRKAAKQKKSEGKGVDGRVVPGAAA